jgi:hypothetical protein
MNTAVTGNLATDPGGGMYVILDAAAPAAADTTLTNVARITDDVYVIDRGEGTAPIINMGAYETISSSAGLDVNYEAVISWEAQHPHANRQAIRRRFYRLNPVRFFLLFVATVCFLLALIA